MRPPAAISLDSAAAVTEVDGMAASDRASIRIEEAAKKVFYNQGKNNSSKVFSLK